MTVSERFLKYIQISTPSDEETQGTPSSACQFDLANVLADEMRAMGLSNVRVNEKCFVFGDLPATPGQENQPVLGLIAHMDTAPSFNGIGVKPQIHKNYDGNKVLLPGSGEYLCPETFPDLKNDIGKTLITTDGTTLLGADDKAGVAEILAACEEIMKSGRPHGKIAVGFTPDEEIGLGVLSFDVKDFGADFAYTCDGGLLGDLNFENFNACEATVTFKGFSVHPGSSKDTMVNASLLAMQFNAMLPSADTPRDTEGYEGFFHLEYMQGDCVSAKLVYIVRDHSAARFDGRKEQLAHITKILNHRWGEGTVTLSIREQYRNMREKIEPHFFLIENACKAMQAVGMEPRQEPIRGGTDGARLSFVGLPCPNLCTGGAGFHGPYEHICVEDMELCVSMLVELACADRK